MQRIVTLCLTATLIMGISAPMYSHAAPGSTTVYITDTGSKYHNSGCRYLKKSSHAISLQDAANSGYSPCSVCSSPALTESAPAAQTPAAPTATAAPAATSVAPSAASTAQPAFDAAFYAAAYPDIVAAYGSDPNILYQHYVLYGAAEGRFPTMDAYLAAVAAAQAVAQ